MACELVLSKTAAKEYRQIVNYLARVLKNPQAAKGFMEEFEQQTQRIRENPEIFAVSRIKELAALGYRTFLVNSYIGVYRLSEGKVFIAHIFHQSQDYARLI